MVHLLALSGAFFAAIAACLFTPGAILQRFAVGSISTNPDCYVGQLGVYESTYKPECIGSTSMGFTSATTNFWPLIPPQNAYGGASPGGVPADIEMLGLSGTPFTNCTGYMIASFTNVSLTLGRLEFVTNSYTVTSSGGTIPTIPQDLSDLLPDTVTPTYCRGVNFPTCFNLMVSETSPADPRYAALVTANGIMNGRCLPYGKAPTRTSCFGGYWFWDTLFVGFSVSSDETSAQVIAHITEQCLDGNKNIDGVKQAQNMVYAALVFIWIGFLLAVAAAFIKNRFVHVAPLIFNLVATILFIVGLVKVAGTPMYASVGAACEGGDVCYETSVARSLAIAGVTFGFLAAVISLLSIFICAPPSSSEQPTEKATTDLTEV